MFSAGELLEYTPHLSLGQMRRLSKQYPLFNKCKQNIRCVCLKMNDATHCTVAPCTLKTKQTAAQCFDLEVSDGKNTFLVCTSRKYIVNTQYFVKSIIQPTFNKNAILEQLQIYEQKKRTQQEYNSKLRQKYKLAVINNDRDAMRKIETELGYAPVGKGTSRSTKTPYVCTNPRAYQGGHFSPK